MMRSCLSHSWLERSELRNWQVHFIVRVSFHEFCKAVRHDERLCGQCGMMSDSSYVTGASSLDASIVV